MSDFKHINEFRKGTILKKISEDPTYLSFFFMFDTVDRAHSPLMAGPAEDYLRDFVDSNLGTNYAGNLANFKKVLLKINKEMPWFWQKITGLELTQMHKDMKEPWFGADTPIIEIECLEENIELTAIALISLYKQAVYDYDRYVEILPKNLRYFRVWTVLSEVRTFQQNNAARDLDRFGSPMAGGNDTLIDGNLGTEGNETATSRKAGEFDKALVGNYTADSKPHLMFELGYCCWDTDSIADMFADASKQPEIKKPKLKFSWKTARISSQKFGPNIDKDSEDLVPTSRPGDDLYPNTPFNPLANVQNAISDKVNGIAGSLVNRFNNLKNSLPGQGNNPMGRVYPEGFTGAAATLLNSGLDKLKSLILDNVHGAGGTLSTLGDINSALEAGSINGIRNLAGQLLKKKVSSTSNEGITPNQAHDAGVDSSPDGSINEKVYEPVSKDETKRRITPGRIHEKGIDSSPDGNLNDNIHN